MSNTNLIFLDVDGVLNPVDGSHEHVFDSGCVQNLKLILDAVPNTRVVFSTSWRSGFTLFRLGWLWRHHGFDEDLVLGGTPELQAEVGYEVRGKEIAQWLAGRSLHLAGLELTRYAVLDDEMEHIQREVPAENLFPCEPQVGLTAAIARSVSHFLLTGTRTVSAQWPQVRRRLPVYCDCDGIQLPSEAPVLHSLGFTLKLVQHLRQEGQFIGIQLNPRLCFQVAFNTTGAGLIHAEILDSVCLTTEATRLTREQLTNALRSAYDGRDLKGALCGCVWSCPTTWPELRGMESPAFRTDTPTKEKLSMSHTETVPPAEPAAGEGRLRQLCVEGLARRYTLRARVEGRAVIIEGVEEPQRLPTFKGKASTSIRPASGLVPAPEEVAAIRVVIDRLQLELKAIEQAGLAAYFLLVAECARYGRSIGASCLAIGSCPGSLATYLLEISTVDPIRHGLLFERFWNPERINPPVIYLEFADDRLDEVIEHARKKCGSSPVAHLVTDLESDLAAELPTLGLLGLKALTVLRRTCERTRQTKSIEVPLDQLPLDDVKIYDLLKRGDTSGIFQLESGEMPALCRKLQPNCFAHISALVALYRPGLMDRIPDFIERRHGKVAVVYGHPLLECISKETYGVLIYQEQVMQAAQILAGYTLGSADLLRRAMAKRKFEEMAQHRELFVNGCMKANSIPATEANQLFDWLVEFAGYGFNKSHAAAYAMVAYQTAYLKANYPVECLSAVKAT